MMIPRHAAEWVDVEQEGFPFFNLEYAHAFATTRATETGQRQRVAWRNVGRIRYTPRWVVLPA